MSANRVAAINPPIDDTDPIRKFSIDPGSHTDWQKQGESLQKGSRYGISVSTPTSSIRTPIADAIFADAISETPRVVFTGGIFRKGARVAIGVPGGGVWGRVQGGGGGGK